MIYYQIPVPEDLQTLVRSFSVVEEDLDPGCMTRHRLTADPCPAIVFHYKNLFATINEDGTEGLSPQCHYHGQSVNSQEMKVKGSYGLFCIYLNPFSSYRLFGIPALKLSNYEVGLHDLLGPAFNQLEDQVLTARCNQHRAEIVTKFLRNRLTNTKTVDVFEKIVISLLNTENDVGSWFLQANLSRRQFERRFLQAAGHSPKLYEKLIRFRKTFKLVENGFVNNFTEAAFAGGYFDQSHFIRDFKQFTGITPHKFFSTVHADNFSRAE